jgi:crossover junction endonuclease MUS81
VTLIFERKSISDLAASIKDSRYKEQKYRMLSTHAPHHITYIIEGTSLIAKDEHGLSKSVYTGMYAYTMYRDGMHVIHVANTKETALWILNVATKLQSNPQKFLGSSEVPEYISTRKAKIRRIDNITPYNCYLMQLSQIPGISFKIAESIAETYPSMIDLVQALHNCTTDNERCAMIAKIPCIGIKKAKILVEYLKKPTHDEPCVE